MNLSLGLNLASVGALVVTDPIADTLADAIVWFRGRSIATGSEQGIANAGTGDTLTNGLSTDIEAIDATLTAGPPALAQVPGIITTNAPAPTITGSAGAQTVLALVRRNTGDANTPNIYGQQPATNVGSWFYLLVGTRPHLQVQAAGVNIPTGIALDTWSVVGYRLDSGTGHAYRRGYGLSAALDYSGAGNVTMASPLIGGRGSWTATSPGDLDIAALVDIREAKTLAEMDEIGDWMLANELTS